jgi:hypothetical protein
MLTITAGSSDPAKYEIPSCISDIPGPEDDVIALAPEAEAPSIMLIEAISLSAGMKVPPTLGRFFARYSGISF